MSNHRHDCRCKNKTHEQIEIRKIQKTFIWTLNFLDCALICMEIIKSINMRAYGGVKRRYIKLDNPSSCFVSITRKQKGEKYNYIDISSDKQTKSQTRKLGQG